MRLSISTLVRKLRPWFWPGVGLGLASAILFWAMLNFAGEWIPDIVWTPVRQADLLERPEAKRCGECHQEIFEAWKKSRHALAWVSKNYIKDSEDRSKKKCLPCHIPTTVFPGEKPEPRLDRRDEGIYCVPCHVRDGAMRGPHRLVAPPHPTQYDQDFNSSKICGSCHEKTYEQWQKTEERETCQSCHMPRTKMRLTQKVPLSWLHTKKWVGDHRFLHGDFQEDTLRLAGTWDENFLTVTLENLSVPHHVPTADNGDPRLYLEVVLHDAAGGELDVYKEILAPQQDTALAWHKPVSYNYRTPQETATALIHLRYRPAWSREKQDVMQITAPRAKGG